MNSADFDPENPEDPENTEDQGFALPIASNWLRAQGITIDWIGSLFVATLLVESSWTLLFFFFQVTVLTALTGSSAGQKLRGIRIIDVNTLQNISPLGALIRTILIMLVIPAVVQNKEGRGLHDLATKSAAVRF